MAEYSVLIDRGVWKKDFQHVPRGDLVRIMRQIGRLAPDPRLADAKKLTGQSGYRVHQGTYRILYEVDDARYQVIIRKVAHRREAYRS